MEVPKVTFGQVTVYLGDKNGKYPDGNQVVVQGRQAKVIFDTPLVANRLRAELQGTDMVILGHVHEDHCAGLHMLPHAKVLVHERDVNAVRSMEGLLKHYGLPPEPSQKMIPLVTEEFFFRPRPDAQPYASESSWDVGGSTIHALHMPGHTGGHTTLLVEPEGVAFIGDIDLTGFGPYYGDGCSNLEEFERSMDRLEKLEARVWVTSHHKGVVTERAAFDAMLAVFRRKIPEREAAMLAQIKGGLQTLEQLVAHRFVYPQWYDGIWTENCERLTAVQHLRRMVGDGRLELDERGRYHARG